MPAASSPRASSSRRGRIRPGRRGSSWRSSPRRPRAASRSCGSRLPATTSPAAAAASAAVSRRAHGHHRDRRNRRAAICRDRHHAHRQSRGAARADVDVPLASSSRSGRCCRPASPPRRSGPTAICASSWMRLLVLAFAMYAVFTAYPIVVGRRARGERDPYLAAVLAQRDVLLRGARRARRRGLHLDGRSAAGLRRAP